MKQYHKWLAHINIKQLTTRSFTEMVAGPMDYSPGGFLKHTPKNCH
jgi:hypothetical protein